MAHVENSSNVEETVPELSAHTTKSVGKLLKDNPYVAGVAAVSAIEDVGPRYIDRC